MKKILSKSISAGVIAACVCTGAPVMQAMAAETDTSAVGTLAFAQCEEGLYINIRESAGMEGEVTAKIYNNGAAEILAEEEGWYKIQSGNAVGYAKAEYFVTGEEAEKVAQKVAYNVATVHPEELNIRVQPDEDSEVVDTAYKNQELEVVAYDGDWMKVALTRDSFGYINAYYADYTTYYPHAETLEEEQARLSSEADKAGSYTETAETEYTEPEYTEDEYTEPEYTETEYTEPEYTETEYTEPEYTETEYTEPEYTETEYTEPEYTETEYTEPEYTETEYTEPGYTETEYTEPEYTETEYTEPEYTETEYTEPEYTETEYTEPEYTETEYTEPENKEEPSSGTGQQIADYAVQFVGNPYVWGGTSLTSGADCSGFVQSVFANFGIGLARVAADQAGGGTSVSLDSIQAGDLLFYDSGSGIDHVAIYIGGGQIVHAANASSGITTSSAYYSTPVSACRYW